MNIDGKEVIMMVAIGLAGLMFGGMLGFVTGVWAGNLNGYDEGIEAGIKYSNCVVERTPLYGIVTDKTLDDCWETYVYESY